MQNSRPVVILRTYMQEKGSLNAESQATAVVGNSQACAGKQKSLIGVSNCDRHWDMLIDSLQHRGDL